MQRKGGSRQHRRKKNDSDADSGPIEHHRLNDPSSNVRSSVSRLLLLLLFMLLFALLLYLAAPGSFSRSKASQRGDENTNGSPNGDMEESLRASDKVTCKELVAEAKQIMDTGVVEGDEAELALDMLASCALKEPDSAIPRWNLAAALLQMGRIEEALPFLNKALTLDPNNLSYLLNGGKVLAGLGRHREAVKCLEKYLEVSLRIPSWEKLLASISILREDEWEFLKEVGPELIPVLEMLLKCYLNEASLIKAGYMYKVVIGLRGAENVPEIVLAHAFFCFGLGDIVLGITQLRVYTEVQYVLQNYGSIAQAKEVVTAHSLRLLTAGMDSFLINMAKNLLLSPKMVWEELVYNCNIDPKKKVDFSESISQKWLWSIFKNCISSQQVIKHLLKEGAAVHAENLFGFTPLMNIILLDDKELLQQMLTAKANPTGITALGLTSLHVAVMRGSNNIIAPLIAAGAKIDSRDALNRTAIDVACLHRWSNNDFLRSFKSKRPSNCQYKPTYLPPLKQGFKNGGWFGSGAYLPPSLTEERCDFDVIGYNADTQTLLFNYLSLHRPVLVHNATSFQQMRKLFEVWQRNKIIKEYGHLAFNEVMVPYIETSASKRTQTTLKKFLEKMTEVYEQYSTVQDTITLPHFSYIYEAIPTNSPLLEHFNIPLILNTSVTHIATIKTVFYVGPPLSGSPFHFHRSSWNVLVYGLKRWFVQSPKNSFYSKQHPWDWWKARTKDGSVLECVQHPGDLVFIPDMWGHSVLNLKESIGVASEFIHGASEFSL